MAILPKAYQKAPDGSILKVTKIYQKDSLTTVATIGDGYTKTKVNEVSRFYEVNQPPLYITLTVAYPFPDDFEISIEGNEGKGSLVDFEVDKGDGIFVSYVQLNTLLVTPLGANIIIKSTDDVGTIRITDVNNKGGD